MAEAKSSPKPKANSKVTDKMSDVSDFIGQLQLNFLVNTDDPLKMKSEKSSGQEDSAGQQKLTEEEQSLTEMTHFTATEV